MRTVLILLLHLLGSGSVHAMPPDPEDLSPTLCADTSSTCNLTSIYQIREDGVVDMGDVILQFMSGGGIVVDGVQATVMARTITAFPGSSFSGTTPESRLGLMASENIDSYGNYNFKHTDGGGSLWMAADGTLTIWEGEIEAGGTTRSAEGGTIDLWAGDELLVDGIVTAEGGIDRAGGSLILSSDGQINLRGTIDLRGGEGGRLIMSAPGGIFVGMIAIGDLDPEPTAIDLSSRSGNGGGGLLWASSKLAAGLHADINLNGSAGSAGQGDGGSIVVLRTGATFLSGTIEAMGSGLESRGGQVWIDIEGSLQLDSAINLSASGEESTAGSLDIVALGSVGVHGEITAEAKGRGGQISLVGVEGLDITAPISVDGITSSSAGGGSIQLIALDGPVSLSETISLSGRPGSDGGGSLDVHGCTAQTSWGADITATGTNGKIQITGIDGMHIGADIDAASGEITLITKDSDPVQTDSPTLDPSPTVLLDPTLLSCPCEGADCTDPLDQDGDGYRSSTVRGDDCDDSDPNTHPGAPELPDDDVDNDCDGTVDELADAGDTGEAADTAEPSEDGDGDSDDTAEPADDSPPAESDTGDKPTGCGCSTGHSPGGLVLLLGLLPWARRRASSLG